MRSRIKKELNLILHPYQFVLKEGQGIQDNFFDYSLLMLQMGCPETIRSPQSLASSNAPLVADLQVFNFTAPEA